MHPTVMQQLAHARVAPRQEPPAARKEARTNNRGYASSQKLPVKSPSAQRVATLACLYNTKTMGGHCPNTRSRSLLTCRCNSSTDTSQRHGMMDASGNAKSGPHQLPAHAPIDAWTTRSQLNDHLADRLNATGKRPANSHCISMTPCLCGLGDAACGRAFRPCAALSCCPVDTRGASLVRKYPRVLFVTTGAAGRKKKHRNGITLELPTLRQRKRVNAYQHTWTTETPRSTTATHNTQQP